MLVVPVASGAGSAAPVLPPEPSLTRYEPPAAIEPLSEVTSQLDPGGDDGAR